MSNHHDVHELIHRCWNTPDGPARIVLAEQALAQAEALGDEDLLYSANCAATSAYHQSGEPMKAMMTFARCLSAYDADPGRRSEDDERLLLWQFKHVVSAMSRFPQLPLERTMAVLDDMQRRYQAGGHSLQAVYAYRHDVAAHVGDTVLADHWYRMWDAAPRDRHSDCAGCDPSSKAYHLAWRGRDEDAIAVAEPALSGRLTCSEQPHGILTALLLPYLRTGRLDEARDAHRRAYRALCDNKAELGRVARHVEFCGLTGNEPRGLELIERHLSWLDEAPTPKTEMEFAAAAALVLRRLAEAGRGELEVRRAGGAVTVAELGPVLRERAEAIARRFDARNGNTFQSERVAEVADAQPLTAYLPLSLTSAYAAAPEPVAAAPQEADISAVSPNLPLDAQLDLAEQWFGEDDGVRGKALARRLLAATAETPLTDLQQGRLARLRANCFGDDEAEQTAQAHGEAVAAFERAGHRELELATRVQWEISLLRATGDESHLENVFALTEQALEVSTDPVLRRNTLLRAAWLAAMAGDPDRALSLAVRAEAEPGPVPPSRRGRLLHLRAGAYHAHGRLDDAEAALHEAIGELRGTIHRDMLGSLLTTLARLVGERRDPESNQAAIAAFEEAAAVAEDPELRRSARANAAFMLVTTPRAGEFIDDIVEHVCLMEAEGSAQAACYTRHRLALALYTVDRDREAAEVAEEALAWFLAQRDDEQYAEIIGDLRELLSRIYATLGEPHVALGQLDALLETVTGVERLPQRAELLERAGELLWQVDRDADAAARFDAAAQAYGQADLPLETVHARRREVMALYHCGRHDDARAAAARLVELMDVTEVPEAQQPGLTWEKATAGYEAALILTNTDQPDYEAALHRITPVPVWYQMIGAVQEALFAKLRHGQVLVVAGRPEPAEPLLWQVLEGLPEEQGARRDAAFWLARALDEQGGHDRAAKLRAEFDLPQPEQG